MVNPPDSKGLGMRALIGAHRGAMGYAPENTIAAFRIAAEQHTWRIECDVRRTADGALVMLHDETVDRTTNGSGPIRELSFASLRKLRSGDELVPTLAETLEFARDRVRLLVEIKDYAAVDPIVTVIQAAGMASACTISCFDEGVLKRSKELCPELATAWFHLQPGTLDIPRLVSEFGVAMVIVWPAAVEPRLVQQLKAAGLHIRCGMPDNLTFEDTAARVGEYVALGIDEISCGRPDWIGRALEGER